MNDTPTGPRYGRNPDLLTVEMDGDLVMMSIQHGNYYGVGGMGPHVWRLLETSRTTDELVDNVCQEFAVDQTTARADMKRFLADLVENDLVTVS